MCVYYIQVCHGNAPTVTKQIQSIILMSPIFCSQDPRTLVKTIQHQSQIRNLGILSKTESSDSEEEDDNVTDDQNNSPLI